MTQGTVVGIDPGSRRIGVAVADLETRFARPLSVLAAGKNAVAELAALIDEQRATEVVVGKPISLSGAEGPAVARQRDFVTKLRAAVSVPITEFDERFTTVAAEQALRASGASASKRKEIRDAVAAQVMLQTYLDSSS